MEPVDIAAIVADTSKEFVALAQLRHIEIKRDLQSAIVDGDERRLRELTRNLLDNALRHAQSAVTVAAHPSGRWVELEISNDGQTVAPELRERIFERFFSGNGAQRSGLGLPIVRWIAQAHGGTAFVRESAGGAAHFVVRLPLVA